LIARHRNRAKLIHLDFLVFDAPVVIEGIFKRTETDAYRAHDAKLDLTPRRIQAILQLAIRQSIRLRDRRCEREPVFCRFTEDGLADRFVMLMLMQENDGILKRRTERVDRIANPVNRRRGRQARKRALRGIDRFDLKNRIGAEIVCHVFLTI